MMVTHVLILTHLSIALASKLFFALKGQPHVSPGQSATAKPYSAALGWGSHGKDQP